MAQVQQDKDRAYRSARRTTFQQIDASLLAEVVDLIGALPGQTVLLSKLGCELRQNQADALGKLQCLRLRIGTFLANHPDTFEITGERGTESVRLLQPGERGTAAALPGDGTRWGEQEEALEQVRQELFHILRNQGRPVLLSTIGTIVSPTFRSALQRARCKLKVFARSCTDFSLTNDLPGCEMIALADHCLGSSLPNGLRFSRPLEEDDGSEDDEHVPGMKGKGPPDPRRKLDYDKRKGKGQFPAKEAGIPEDWPMPPADHFYFEKRYPGRLPGDPLDSPYEDDAKVMAGAKMSAKGKGEYSRHPDYDKPKGKGKDPLGRSKGGKMDVLFDRGPPRGDEYLRWDPRYPGPRHAEWREHHESDSPPVIPPYDDQFMGMHGGPPKRGKDGFGAPPQAGGRRWISVETQLAHPGGYAGEESQSRIAQRRGYQLSSIGELNSISEPLPGGGSRAHVGASPMSPVGLNPLATPTPLEMGHLVVPMRMGVRPQVHYGKGSGLASPYMQGDSPLYPPPFSAHLADGSGTPSARSGDPGPFVQHMQSLSQSPFGGDSPGPGPALPFMQHGDSPLVPANRGAIRMQPQAQWASVSAGPPFMTPASYQ
jgi:hypothetical protein